MLIYAIYFFAFHTSTPQQILADLPSRRSTNKRLIMSIRTIDPTQLSQREVHQYLLTAVAPRPICFASTVDTEGNVNLSPFSFFNVFSSNPPVMVFSPSRSGRDGSTKDTLDNVQEVKEVTINIVNYPIVEQMSLASTAYDKGVNEFVKAGLTEVASTKVRPPRVAESPVAFECVVDQVIALGDGPGAGNLVVARVVMIHLQEEYLDAEGKLDTIKLDLVSRMGGIWYSRAIPESLFEIPKPLRNLGIGVDQLPSNVRNSHILTGNNIGRLGNLKHLPSTEELANLQEDVDLKGLILRKAPLEDYHQLAKLWIDKGDTQKALGLLVIAEGQVRNS